MRWTSGAGRPVDAPVEIVHADGVSSVVINQTTNGGAWNYIDTYKFNAGTQGYVQISAASTGSTIADAVLFEKVSVLTDVPVTPTENATTFYIDTTHSYPGVVLNLASDATVSLSVYSMLGRVVRVLVHEQHLTESSYRYSVDSSGIPRGIYLIRLTINGKPSGCKKIFIP